MDTTKAEKAKKLLHIFEALASGKKVQQLVEGDWIDKHDFSFVDGCEWRVKPEIIIVNGFEVPKPMREEPDVGSAYYITSFDTVDGYEKYHWFGDDIEQLWMSKGICHFTKEAAIAHAKAMLGVKP